MLKRGTFLTIVLVLFASGCSPLAAPSLGASKVPVTLLPTSGLGSPLAPPTSTPSIPLELRWETVPGGADISREITPSCIASSEITEDGVMFVAKQGSNPIKPLNSYIRFRGDFGLAIRLKTQPAKYAGLTLYDRLPWSLFESNFKRPWWQGFRRMDISIVPGGLNIDVFDGQQEAPIAAYSDSAPIPGESFDLWVRKMGDEMVFFINYVEVRRIAEDGFFSGGVTFLGLSAAPHDQVILNRLSIEAPTEDVGNIEVVSFFDPGVQIVSGDTLQSLAAQHSLLLGTFVEPWTFIQEKAYADIAVNQFSLWETIRLVAMPQDPDAFDFCMADMFVELASRYEKPIHVKDVIWHGRIPDWLLRPGSGPAEWANMIGDPAEFEGAVKDYVHTIVGRYRGRVYAYDVVAEAIRDPGTTAILAPEPLRDSPWLIGLGPDYIDKVFRWVDEADPHALLFYNDYNAEGLGEKSDYVYQLVSGMLERGVPIDGVGFQMHFWDLVSHPSPEEVAANMKRLTDLGLLVTITEMDVVIHNGSGTPEDKLQQQADWYAAILNVCMGNPRCIGFGTWGFTDKHSWLYSPEPGTYSNQGPLLFDTDYQPKPAFYALMDTLQR